MTTLTISEARKKLPTLVGSVRDNFDRVAISQKDRISAILISPEELEDIQETLEIMSDSKIIRALAQSRRDEEEGKLVSHEEVFKS